VAIFSEVGFHNPNTPFMEKRLESAKSDAEYY
jgi:hypothetical protein